MKKSKMTAIQRPTLSKPLRWILEVGEDMGRSRVFHQGPGRPTNPDREHLRAASAICLEYDPHWGPKDRKVLRRGNCKYAVSIYVLNVLPPKTRRQALRDLRMTLTVNGVAYIAVRRNMSNPISNLTPHEDGFMTTIGTFQKQFTYDDLRDWVTAYFYDFRIAKYDSDTLLIRASKPRRKECRCFNLEFVPSARRTRARQRIR